MRILMLLVLCVVSAGLAAADERVDRWREDLDVARAQWLAKDRSFARADRAEAERRLVVLGERIGALQDFEIAAELGRIAALSRNAHTRAYLLRNRGYWRRFPIRIWRFADGWRVVAARDEGDALLGGRLIAINGTPIADAQASVRPLYAGNDRWADYMASYTLTSPEALHASGVISSLDAADFTIEWMGGELTWHIKPLPHELRNAPEESWWFLSPAHSGVKGWTHALKDKQLPPVLRGADRNYRVAACGGETVYFQFNRAQNGEGEALIPFGKRLVAQVEAHPPAKLIVDLRFNTGGDATLGHQFFKLLTALAWTRERGRVIAILGPNTFSAGITPAVWLKQETTATFVGTEPGDQLDTWSEGGNVDLPHSKLRLHYADMAHLYSKKKYDIPEKLVVIDWNVDDLLPDVPADWTWTAYAAGRDPYTEAALGHAMACDS